MCGIAGYIGFDDKRLIKQFSKDLSHRGPDGEGIFTEKNISLLNRRLSIIDLKGGDQPIFNEDESVVVVYNGEIYNYQELRKELEQSGHAFKTNSDTEVIVHGYEEWRLECFERFNGMFGIALYDKKKNQLILARDQFGIKPLYYSLIEKGPVKLMFSSEIKPLINSGFIKKKPNDKVLYRYLRYRIHDDIRETFFEGIERLLPGELMIVNDGKTEIKKYSTLENDLLRHSRESGNLDPRFHEDDGIQKFREQLIKAVTYRLISDVEIGTCLSGGLDSSTVVAIVNKLLNEKDKIATKSIGKKQKTFSAVFPGSNNDEEKYIDALLEKLKNIESFKTTPKPEEFFEEIEDFVRTQEEPTISTGPYAQYQVMKMAHGKVKVLLDGQGADEMMAGYNPYYFVYLRQLLRGKRYGAFFKEAWSSKDIIFKQLSQSKKGIAPGSLLSNKFAEKYSDVTFPVVNDNLKKRLIDDIFRHSLQSLLRYEDRNSMRFSIEGRVPFLDMNLMKYLFSLDESMIIKGGWNKFILRQSVKELLPDMIANRRNKIGFTTPEQEWFLRMKNRIYGIFMSESFANRPYFNQPEVLKAFQAYIEGKNDDTLLFWRILNVELWLRIFFDPPSHKTSEGQAPRKEFQANEGKKIEIEVDEKTYKRFPVKTELFKKGDNYVEKITVEVVKSVTSSKLRVREPWFAVVSEKIVAISQGRSYFIWDINPGFWAKTLSKYVKKTPYGIGLGSPWTMQIAINEIGLPRILFASIAAVVTKPFGIKGIFYHIVGRTVASIDGPTEYSLYPSNVSAKLGPKDPQLAAEKIHAAVGATRNAQRATFQGVVIIDANDLGRDILGNTTKLSNKTVAELFRDNPMGQGSEQTPIVIVVEK